MPGWRWGGAAHGWQIRSYSGGVCTSVGSANLTPAFVTKAISTGERFGPFSNACNIRLRIDFFHRDDNGSELPKAY